MIRFSYLLCLFFGIAKGFNNKFMPEKTVIRPGCEGGVNKTNLVERFFTVIFTEFQPVLPVCVCVQMCPDQPTYCYPNGCLKIAEHRKPEVDVHKPPPSAIPSNVHNNDGNFLFDDKAEYAKKINYAADENIGLPPSASTNSFFKDPFRDMYKTMTKYKKMPKVEIRYNLREQVKNMKSDILKVDTDDVSKTRWPKTSHKLYHDQNSYTKNIHPDVNRAQPGHINRYLHSNLASVPSSRYFKRDLRRIQETPPRESPFSSENTEMHEPPFSLDTLIDNLLGNENRSNFTNIELHVYTVNDVNSINHSNNDTSIKTQIDSDTYTNITAVEEVLKKWSNYTFNEMIAALSKQIEKQNKTNLEMVRHTSRDDTDKTKANILNSLYFTNNSSNNCTHNNNTTVSSESNNVVKVNND